MSYRGTLSASVLKTIAYISMIIDHTSAVVLLPFLVLRYGGDAQHNLLYQVGRSVGRLSFVLFAFLIAEGMRCSHDRIKYILRLFVFALLSEIPFDLAIEKYWFDMSYQNVYFTLCIGALAILGIQRVSQWQDLSATNRDRIPKMLKIVLYILITALSCFLAVKLKTDYSVMGVLLIIVCYVFSDNFVLLAIMGTLTIYFGELLAYIIKYPEIFFAFENIKAFLQLPMGELYGILSFSLINMYNGRKGQQLSKGFYYSIYPVHLVILAAIYFMGYFMGVFA